MTRDEKIEAEVQRIVALPDDEQAKEILSKLGQLPDDKLKDVIAYMRDIVQQESK
jgi:hypothetical protein